MILTAISACFWMNAPPETVSGKREPSILSYAVPESHNEFLVFMDKNLIIMNKQVPHNFDRKAITYVVK